MKFSNFALLALLTSAAFALSACDKADETTTEVATQKAPAEKPTWQTDLDSALNLAKDSGNDVFCLFTGTEWCPPCIELEKNVFGTDIFNETAAQFVPTRIVVKRALADNSEDVVALLAKYRISMFPTVVLFDSSGYPYAVVTGAGDAPADYLKRVADAKAIKAERDALFAEAKKTPEGLERAKVLANALEKVPVTLRSFYPEVSVEIQANDTEDVLGFAAAAEHERLIEEQSDALKKLIAKCVGENGERTTPECVEENIKMTREFLETNNLLPPIRQEALKFIGESYAVRNDISLAEKVTKIRECFIEAVEADPESRLASRLKDWIAHYDDILEQEAAKNASAEQETEAIQEAVETEKEETANLETPEEIVSEEPTAIELPDPAASEE